MTMQDEEANSMRVLQALEDSNSSVRLQAAMAIGGTPDPQLLDRLIERCAIEPDFSVREMLTWAITRYSSSLTIPKLLDELRSEHSQAKSQALHTLSKIGDPVAWPAITRELLLDQDDEVARTAWRTAVALVPESEERELAGLLVTQLGRGKQETQLSLSRALVGLGDLIKPFLSTAMTNPEPHVREHVIATEKLLIDPGAGFGFLIEEAKRVVALGPSSQEG